MHVILVIAGWGTLAAKRGLKGSGLIGKVPEVPAFLWSLEPRELPVLEIPFSSTTSSFRTCLLRLGMLELATVPRLIDS